MQQGSANFKRGDNQSVLEGLANGIDRGLSTIENVPSLKEHFWREGVAEFFVALAPTDPQGAYVSARDEVYPWF